MSSLVRKILRAAPVPQFHNIPCLNASFAGYVGIIFRIGDVPKCLAAIPVLGMTAGSAAQ